MDPEGLVNNIPDEVAEQILREWREAKDVPGLAKARVNTIAQYRKNAAMLEAKYSRDNNVDLGSLSPVDLLKQFFKHAADLQPATWKLYRHSLLYIMNERAVDMASRGMPQKTLVTALAALIVISKQPYQNADNEYEPAKKSRAKSMRARYFDRLITHLAVDYPSVNIAVRRAQSFAMATLATGLRPTEWKHVHLRTALPGDLPFDTDRPEAWLILRIKTAKRKEDEVDWERTFFIEPGPYQIHILQHYQSIMDAVNKVLAKDPASETPDKKYIARSSGALSKACKHLWPTRPDLWVTLYSLRSQARANFASVHGLYVAAAMLGHAPAKSQVYYAGVHRANLARGGDGARVGAPVPVPGQDVLTKAAEFAVKAADQQSQLAAQRQAPLPHASETPA
jgi:hypothetical protein